MEQAVERVIDVMRTRYHERLYVPELAADEFYSPFHFSRIFRRDTGVSPCQYLTAVRLFHAKRQLLSTSDSVAEIACRVGYSGIGTFTTRFTRMVGMSPGKYRQLPRDRMLCLTDYPHRLPSLPMGHRRVPTADRDRATIDASVHIGADAPVSRLLVGVFDDPIPQGPPVAWTLLPGSPFGCAETVVRFQGIPEGRWVVLAAAEGQPAAIRLDLCAPVEAAAGTVVTTRLVLHRPRRTAPPIMVPLAAGPLTGNRMAA